MNAQACAPYAVYVLCYLVSALFIGVLARYVLLFSQSIAQNCSRAKN